MLLAYRHMSELDVFISPDQTVVFTCWTQHHSFIIANSDVTLHYTRVPLPMRPGVAT